jgi:TOTE conflict system primase-like protein
MSVQPREPGGAVLEPRWLNVDAASRYLCMSVDALYHRMVFPNHRPPRTEALTAINEALRVARGRLAKRGFKVHAVSAADMGETKLLVQRGDLSVKIEAKLVIRGTVYPTRTMPLSTRNERQFLRTLARQRSRIRRMDSTSRHLARVGDLAAGDGSNVRGLNGRHRRGAAVESSELDFESFTVRVDMDHRPHIANLQAFLGNRSSQDDPFVFSDHAEASLPAGVGRHQSRRVRTSIDDPDRPHQRMVRGVCEKPRIKCAGCPNRRFLPVTDEVIRWHLSGYDTNGQPFVAGVYPLLRDETCFFLAVDFDKAGWREDATAFLDACRRLNLPAALERSRSGRGAHVWFFFEEAIRAALARRLGSHVLTETMEGRRTSVSEPSNARALTFTTRK